MYVRLILPANPAHTLTQSETDMIRLNPVACQAADAWLEGIAAFPGRGRRIAATLRSFADRHADNVEQRHCRIDDSYTLTQWVSHGGDFSDRAWRITVLTCNQVLLGWHLAARGATTTKWDHLPLWETHRNRRWGAHTPQAQQVDAPLAALMLALNRRLQRDAAEAEVQDTLQAGRRDLLIETPGGYLELDEVPEAALLAQRGWKDLHNLLEGPGDAFPAFPELRWAADLLRRLPGVIEESDTFPHIQEQENRVNRMMHKAIQDLLDAEKLDEQDEIPDWEKALLSEEA